MEAEMMTATEETMLGHRNLGTKSSVVAPVDSRREQIGLWRLPGRRAPDRFTVQVGTWTASRWSVRR
jgi:hypothetical protein